MKKFVLNFARLWAAIGCFLLANAAIANAQTEPDSYTIDGTTFTHTQNEQGTSLDIQDARGVLTRYLYNNLGLISEEQSAERGATAYEYDAIGNVTKMTRAGGLVTKREFDDQNRLIREVMKEYGAERKVNRYSYDNCANGAGRLCKVVSNGHVTKYAYNEAGAFTKIATKYDGEDDFEITRYSYDASGRAIKLHYPTGLMVHYHYNEDGVVTKLTGRYETGEDRESFVIAKNIRFNPETGQLAGLKFGNGLKTSLSYDDKARLSAIKTSQNGQALNRAAYRFNDDTHHIEAITRMDGAQSQSFAYDGSGRLIEERRGDDLGSGQITSYRYDAVGNRLSRESGQQVKAYNYAPDANRLDQINGQYLSYDIRGNLLDDKKGKRVFTYDATNRMTGFYKQGELKASYDYNAFGQRIRKTLHRPARGDDSYRSLHFAYTPSGELLSEWGRRSDRKRSFARDYVWLGARPIAQIERRVRPNGTTRKAKISYLHTDHLNAPDYATDEAGQVIWRWARDAFGKGSVQRDVDGDGHKTVIRLRFPGQYYDRESGLFYNHHRDYDPALGRYIQSDPIGLSGG